ncbi:MAG: hypothetical protein M0R75_12255 [Dehalococcoidia bacterium]|nr:hypothetical protein [Dehalococcoidia bacterium]
MVSASRDDHRGADRLEVIVPEVMLSVAVVRARRIAAMAMWLPPDTASAHLGVVSPERVFA